MFCCPECSSSTKVYKSRNNLRYRTCMKCNYKFATKEVLYTRYGTNVPDMVQMSRYGTNVPDMVQRHNSKERKKESTKERKKGNNKNKYYFDFNINTYVGIDENDKKRWSEAYPAIDIETEIKKSAEWLIANPKNKKSNYARFLNNWFSKSQDRAIRTGQPKKEETLAERYAREKGLTLEELKNG